MSIAENWQSIQKTIAAISSRPVDCMAVTKLRSLDEIRAVIAAGAVIIGENRVEEAREKFINGGLRAEFPDIILHMIGHLQSRKARYAVELFDCIQSLDSPKLAREVDKRCAPLKKCMDVLIEVNVSGEDQKYGVAPAAARELVEEVVSLPSLRLRGLMTMAPYTDDEELLRTTFSSLRSLRDDLAAAYDPAWFVTLSMGMTNDYRLAVEEGSTMVRIGSALFESPS